MRYRNTKTGFVFESSSEVSGPDWEELNPVPVTKEKTEKKKPTKTKKVIEDD